MTLDEALRHAVDNVPPVGIAEVLERAERRPARRARPRRRRVGALVAALVAVVVAGTVLAVVRSDGDDAVTTAGTDDDALTVEVTAEGLGPIEVTVGSIRDLPTGTGPYEPDQTHTLLLTNTSDARVYLEDNRLAQRVGDPPGLFVGSQGCGPPGACLLDYRPSSIDPGRTLTVDVYLYQEDADFTTGTAELLVEWRDDRPFDLNRGDDADVEEIHVGRVELRYFR